MVSKRRLLNLLTVLIFISLFVVACERPLGGGDTTTDQTGQTEDPNSGGGTDGGGVTPVDNPPETTDETTDSGETGGEEAVDQTDSTTDGGEDASTDTADSGEEAQDDSAEAGGGAGDATGDAEQTSDEDTGSEEAAADTASDEAADTTTTSEDAAASTTVPATHTVAAGENLYRIGLKYGISWVAIASENGLANPNLLTVGQVLKLPGASAPTPDPEPTPSPQTETTYVVKAGDNLFRIGVQFGISWIQIAEANGLVNPNLIKVGDELKIPVNTPGPAPQFSHVVKQGETLFLISLQYGVAWPAIAETNNLTSPYVIYVGQTLEIPGNQ